MRDGGTEGGREGRREGGRDGGRDGGREDTHTPFGQQTAESNQSRRAGAIKQHDQTTSDVRLCLSEYSLGLHDYRNNEFIIIHTFFLSMKT